MTMKIDKDLAKSILHALEGGMVPENGLPYITVGRKEETLAILHDMDWIAQGYSTFRLMEGAYGSGKSFMARLTKNEALLRNFIVMECDLAPERKLCGTKKEGLETYRMLLSRMSTKNHPSGGALAQIMHDYYEMVAKNEADDMTLKEKIMEMPHGFDFCAALDCYKKAYEENDSEKKMQSLRWLRGEFPNKTEAKKALGLSVIIEDSNWFSYIKIWGIFVREAGYQGMYLIFDELTQITRNIVNSTTREHNFERLLSIYNDCYGNQAKYIGVILCGIPSSIHDTKRGLFSYEALKSRLASSKLQGEEILASPILKLHMLTAEEFAVLIDRVEAIHACLQQKDYYFTEEERILFVDYQYQRIGASSHLTPREFLKDYMTILNLKAEKRTEDSMEDFLYRAGGIDFSASMIGKDEEEDAVLSYENFSL
ncbi:MAG: DUF2791 family P-loop domain-containing protein [Eubacteriales bacterium]|nr:DUF2791 family P-loop domain-containing protein [Eubacteriales bacterium]